MPTTLTLEENGRILHYIMKDPLDFAQINEVEKQANAWYDSAMYPLHTLMDLSELHRLPSGILKFRSTRGLRHANAGETVIVGASVYVEKIGEAFITLSHNNRIHFYPPQKIAEAWEYLRNLIASEPTTGHTE